MAPPKRIVGRAPRWPLAIELAYRRTLNQLVAALGEAARAALARHGQAMLDAASIRGDAEERQDAFADLLAQILLEIAMAVAGNLLEAERLVREHATAVSEFSKRDFRAIVRRAYGVDVVRGNESWLPDRMRAWEAENLELIRSIPQQTVNRLRSEFTNAVLEGRGLRDMTRAVQDSTGANRKRAELVARDQIGKLTSQLNERRQRDIGVRSFLWRTVRDERVRPAHRARDGKEFSYEEPGPRPGVEIRCRCSAAPVLPGLTAEQARGFG